MTLKTLIVGIAALGVLATGLGWWMVSTSHILASIVEIPAPRSSRPDMAVILSGDGGWADLDRDLGDKLVAEGIPVLGIDCLKYFWITRTPDEMAKDFSWMIQTTLDRWQKQKLILIGYSFGASILPFLVNRLPPELLNRVELVVMLSPGTMTNWEVWVDDWITDSIHDGATPTLPEARRMPHLPTVCVYGEEDAEDSLCPHLSLLPSLEILVKPGGHHYDEDYTRLAREILDRLPQH